MQPYILQAHGKPCAFLFAAHGVISHIKTTDSTDRLDYNHRYSRPLHVSR